MAMLNEEADAQAEEIAFRFFAAAHPHEAHADQPERFWHFFSEECPRVSREVMEKLLDTEINP
jgi:hypothetical protein